ncbi:hypothetical protein LTR64_007038 [Lithohypha guttulata]|uniref:uncharacterized protein n=1 Tax=Lithohypha guttulata TaxID=1690604 RepID=UPI002DDF2F23|nr:hypothetical protein LTR51_004405 [Lithohypha guttulata]
MLSQACYAFAALAGLANIAAIAKFSIDLKKQCEDYEARYQSTEVIDTAILLRPAALPSISTDSDHEEQVIQVTESQSEICDEHVLRIANRIPGAFLVLPAVAEEVVPGDQYAQATPSNEATTPHTALSEYSEHALDFPEHLVFRSSPRIPQESFITNASPRDTVGQHREVEQPSLLPDPSPSRYSELDP